VKQPYHAAMSVLFRDLMRGSIFRLCTSNDRPAGLAEQAADKMYRRNQGSLGSATNVYPRIQMAAAKRPNLSWIILGVNTTDGAGNTSGLTACYPGESLQMTTTITELAGMDSVLTTRRASKAGTITTGTANMINGVVRFTLAAGETISLIKV
jgi:hypothetical protein